MINLDKFDNLNLKLLNKLNEDYILLSESGDPFEDRNVSAERSKKLKYASQEAYYKAKDAKAAGVSSKTQAALDLSHLQTVGDRKEDELKRTQKNIRKKINKMQNLNASFIDIISNDEVVSLAEEFENDLNESTDTLLAQLDKKRNKIEQDTEKIKADVAEKIDKTNSDFEEKQNIAQTSIEKEMTDKRDHELNTLQKKQEDAEQKEQQQLTKLQRQEDKIQKMKETERMKKEKNMSQTELTEGIINNIKLHHYENKMEKLAKNKGKLIIKRRKLESKLEKAIEKGHEKKINKLTAKINDIDSTIEEIEKKSKKSDLKLAGAEAVQDFKESFEMCELDMLCEKSDNLLYELDTDPDFLDEETYVYNSLYQQYKDIIEKDYSDPMKIKIVESIKNEFEKGNETDPQKIKVLIMKLKKF